jgi:D-alanyl-D-alanine carboxypeptidase
MPVTFHGATRPQRRLGLIWFLCFLAVSPLSALAAPYAAVVMDARSGEILFARNHDTRLHPASLTKMMTLYIAFEAVKNGEITLDTMVTVSRNAASEPCSCLGLRAGQRIALRYLIRAAAVRSGNDAATAIGEAISGSEAAFAARMTRTARAMGMTNTTFRNAHGLTHSEHLSTARDMTILGRQLFFDYPQYYNLFSRRSTHAGIAEVVNTNRRFLDAYRGADGIKTGYTRAAGFNLVGSAERDGKRIIATVFGGQSVAWRNAEMAKLLDMGFARAPVRVAVSRPPAPNYVAVTDGAGSTGRTVRVSTVVSRSPVPPLRPRAEPVAPPEEVLIALQEGIGNALAEVAQEPAAEIALAAAPAVVPAPRPEGLVEGDTAARAGADAAAPATAEALVVAVAGNTEVPVPETRPPELADAVAVAATPPTAADDPSDAPVIAELSEPVESAVAEALARVEAEPEPTAEPEILLTSSVPPSRPEEDLIVASLPTRNDASPLTEMPTEVITRQLSTSDPRVWGINVGRFGTRFEAERVLMQTALAELSALDGTLRKVHQGSGGFDANFLGMTRDQADLACRRLQARDRLCFTIGP